MSVAGMVASGAGLFALLGSLLDWNVLLESRRAYLFVRVLGRNGARVFYGLLGLFILFIGWNLK